MKFRESQEMYLETILSLKMKNDKVKSINIADELNYSRASISRGVHLLVDKNLITIDKSGYIEFTEEGYKKAMMIKERHDVLTDFLMSLDVDCKEAEDNACRIEHIISDTVFEQIKKYMKTKKVIDNKKNI